MKALFVILLLFISSIQATVAEPISVIRLQEISIQAGDKDNEQPQVMYITPWQEPPGTGRLYQEAASYRDQWLYTIDNERMQRDLILRPQYYQESLINNNH